MAFVFMQGLALLSVVGVSATSTLAQVPLMIKLAGSDDKAVVVGEVVDSVLTRQSRHGCCVILVTDTTSTDLTPIMRLLRYHSQLSWGVAVFEVAIKDQDSNATQAHLSQVVAKALQVGQLSRCVMLVVVSDDPAFLASFAEWSLKGRLLVRSTRLLTITRLPLPELQDLHRYFSMTNSMLLVIEVTTRFKGCHMYIHLPYTDQGSPAKLIAVWTPDRGLALTTHLPLFPNKFNRFTQRPTFTVAMQGTPMLKSMMVPDPSVPGGSKLWFEGNMPDALEMLANSMNFSYLYKQPPDGTWGVKMRNGSWNGMVGMVDRKVVDFTWPIIISNVRILGGRGKPEVDPWGFFLPLSPLVWVVMVTALLLLPAAMLLLASCFSYATGSARKLTDSFVLTRILLQQDVFLPDWWWWERVVLAVWMLMTLVLTRSYAGNLMSLLAVRHISQPYQSLRDVLDDPSATMIWQTGSASYQYFRSAKSGTYREVREAEMKGRVKFLRVPDYKTGADTLVKPGDHVIIDEETLIKVIAVQDFSRSGNCDYYLSRERFLPLMLSLIVPKQSLLEPALSSRILYLKESGIFDFNSKKYIPNSTSCVHSPSKIVVSSTLSLMNIWGMFVVLGAGQVISTVVMCVELVSYRVSDRVHRQQQ